jgi:trehalose-6-phosphate synthase
MMFGIIKQNGGNLMSYCQAAKDIHSKLVKLKRLLFTNYTDESKQKELRSKINNLVTEINVEYTRLRFVHKDLKDFDSPELIGEINVSKVKDMISEIKNFIAKHCQE